MHCTFSKVLNNPLTKGSDGFFLQSSVSPAKRVGFANLPR